MHTLDLCADNDGGLEIKPEFLAHMSELVRQTTKLFQGHHYDHFDFLVALSPHLTGGGLEHTQSTHYVVKASSLGDPAIEDFAAYLMAHEYTHAWCGKYRRPAGDATPDYNTPMQNDLLWVYEGLTEYYGGVLAARSGFRTADQAVNAFGYSLFRGDQPGRAWRSVQDTADASAMFRDVDSSWANWRLSQDYYWDGALLWLEADVKIRQLSHSTKSLDDFAALFLGSPSLGTPPGDTGPGVVPYTLADVVKALNATQPFEWENFWITHLNELTPKLPTDGLKKAGYDYAYSEKMSEAEASFIEPAHMAEMYHSLGFQVMSDGTLSDVWFGSPSFFAGLGPGDKLTQVDGKPYTPEAITEAVRAAKKNALPITLTAIRDDETKTFLIQYHEGLKFSVLRRNANPDLLTMGILRPR